MAEFQNKDETLRPADGRSPALDVIRCAACLSVSCVHFFAQIGFYAEPVQGKRMAVMVLLRSFFMICVPLFILLSGYLLCHKALERRYYGRVWRILGTYALAGLATVAYRCAVSRSWIGFSQLLQELLGFRAAHYAWYIEMYLGLFLLIPFLNVLYAGLPSRRAKLWLIGTGLVLTALPGVVNSYVFSAEWFALPSASSAYVKLMPEWWKAVYPLTYYFMGCYLREYGLRLGTGRSLLLIGLTAVLTGAYNYWRSYGSVFQWGAWADYGSLFTAAQAVLVFAFLLNRDYSRMPGWLRRLLAAVSRLTLGAYMVSWIFEQLYYPVLNAAVPVMNRRLPYAVLIVPAVFLSALALSFVLDKLYGGLAALCTRALRGRRLSRPPDPNP